VITVTDKEMAEACRLIAERMKVPLLLTNHITKTINLWLQTNEENISDFC
jgi:hypothetical protein